MGDGLEFLYICILSTSSAKQASLFHPNYSPGANTSQVRLQVVMLQVHDISVALAKGLWLPSAVSCLTCTFHYIFDSEQSVHNALFEAIIVSPYLLRPHFKVKNFSL